MNHIDPTYHWAMMGLAVLIAICSSYVGLDFVHKVGQRRSLHRSGWILLAAITVGIGFWSMHFVAILALHPMVSIHFDLVWTLLSLVPGVACSFAAFWLVARPRVQSQQILAGSLFLGAGIVGLHYIGMGALHGSILLDYRPSFMVAGGMVAVCGSYLTLRSLKPQQRLSRFGLFHWRFTTALILALTAAGMHFVTMAGTVIQYETTVANSTESNNVDQDFLASHVAIAMFTIVVLVLIGSYLNGQFHDALREAEQELAETLRQQLGMTFKLKKIGNRFVHTLCDGELVYKMGFTPKAIVGKVLSEFLPDGIDIPAKEQFYERAWQGEEVTYTGNVNGVDYLATLRPVFRYGAVSEVIASCVDITELHAAREALRQREAQYRMITQNSSDLIRVVDRYGVVEYASPSHAEVLGYLPEELIGQPALNFVCTDDQPSVKHVFQRMLTSRKPFSLEYRCRHKTGNVITFETRAMSVFDESGQVQSVVLVSRDITERNVAQDTLLRTEKMSLAGQLAAGVAHEIRNPLTSIKGFARLLAGRVDPKSLQYLDIINQEVVQIEAIINEFLLLSKPLGDQTQQANVSWVVRDVTTLLAPEAMMKSVQIHAWFEDLGVSVQCAPNQLKQVFVNILKNAIEAVPEGGNVVIDIEATDEGTVVTRIRDDGPGIPAERLERLGEPFYTTKERGTGLGLMVSHRIIRDCGGDIRFTSEIGEGTTVEVVLPVVAAEALEEEQRLEESIHSPGT